MRGGMHGHWRRSLGVFGVLAATALAAVLTATACDARPNRHPPADTHPAASHPAASPTQPASQAPPAPQQVPAAPQQAPAAPEQAPAADSQTGKAGTLAITFDNREVMAALGKDVRSSTDEDMGRLVDVVVDRDGQPRAAIIDFGGFLGVGSRKIAVDWSALNFSREAAKGVITVELTRDQVKNAPEFKEGNPVVVLGGLAGSAGPSTPTPTPPATPAPAPAREK